MALMTALNFTTKQKFFHYSTNICENRTQVIKKSQSKIYGSTREINKDELVIDWQACLIKSNGNEEFARTLLSMLSDDLIFNAVPTLEKFYPTRNIKALRDELHRSIGGMLFLSVPKLIRTFKEFQTAVKTELSDFNEWEKTYDALKKAITEFQEAYKRGDY
jgi:hypothetical protein